MKELKEMSVKELLDLKCEIDILLREHMHLMELKNGDHIKERGLKELSNAHDLTPFQRTVLTLRFQGMPFTEIADKTKKPKAIVSSTYISGLNKLNRFIEDARGFIDRDSPIECLRLPTATVNALHRGAFFMEKPIYTVGDLMDISDEALLKIPHIGPTRVKEIRDSINKANAKD